MIYTWKLNFALLLSHFLVNLSTRKVVSMLFSQHRWTCVDSTSLFNLIPTLKQTLGHQHWINVTLSTLFQRCFVNVETTSINIRWLNFHFQPNFNVETMLVHRRWIDVILSTLFCQCWNNVDKCMSAQLSFSTKHQRCFNVDVFAGKVSCTLMSLLSFIKVNLWQIYFVI